MQQTQAAITSNTFVRLLLSAPVAGTTPDERVIGRLVLIRGEPMLSLTKREPKRDTTHNLPPTELHAWLLAQVPGKFRSAFLETTERSWQFSVTANGRPKLGVHRTATPTAPPREHDAPSNTWLGDEARPWLTQLGILAADGRERASMAGKHRQLQRYLEILSHLVRDCGWKPGDPVTVADMGCGKGYLTFGAWHLLHRRLGLQAEVTGVETRPDLVERTNAVARAVGAEHLHFIAGDIASARLPRLDALIALHACNTATDDAIRRGIETGARLLVVSPCCHQELRPQLGGPEPFAQVLRHGIMAERMSEWLTDGLRALHLEHAGYATKVIEFVATEHTARNLLLAGVRQEPRDPAAMQRAADRIRALKDFFGIKEHALDPLLASSPV